ncbi:hypothetical protein HNY73_005016 [Argiope bruennichi]|uniref:RNase H type-1 domain-containing protein n=1 Tax=Argiope bruennichi TaxID=94029 RepID=A0A8T0FKV9_ARGBR|nr:hypothetical protein HNY73_005016 [Argiope bruennichi]
MNISRGVLSEPDFIKVSEAEFLEELRDQNVCAARRINIRRESGHEMNTCTSDILKCANCSGSHAAFSKSCPKWILEKEIISIKIKKNITFPEARKIVNDRTPKVGVSYSSAVKSIQNTSCSQTDVNITHCHCTITNPVLPTNMPSTCVQLQKTSVTAENLSPKKSAPRTSDVSKKQIAKNRKKLKSLATRPHVAEDFLKIDTSSSEFSDMELDSSASLKKNLAEGNKKKKKPPDKGRNMLSACYYFRVLSNRSHPLRRMFLNCSQSPLFNVRRSCIPPLGSRILKFLPESYHNIEIHDESPFSVPPWCQFDVVLLHPFRKFLKSNTPDFIFRALFSAHRHMYSDYIPVYTDGSKAESHVGYAFACESVVVGQKLHDFTSVFTSEVTAIYRAIQYIAKNKFRKVIIYSDSWSALQALIEKTHNHAYISDSGFC